MRKLVLISFLSQIFGFIFYYATSFILVRIISPSEFGIFQKFNLLITTVIPMIGFTLVSSQFYFYPIANESEKSKVVNQTFLLLFLGGLVFMIFFSLAKNFFLSIIQLDELSAFPNWIFLTLPLYSISSIADNLFILDKRKAELLFFIPMEKAFFLISVLIFYYYTKTLNGIFYGITVYSIVKTFYLIFYIQIRHGFNPLSTSVKRIVMQLNYCIPFYFATVLYTISLKLDKILISKYVCNEEFAYYSVSFLSIPMLANAISSINNVTLPEITEKLLVNDLKGVRGLYRNIVTKTTSISFPFLVYFIVNSKEIISLLFTTQYLSANSYYKVYTLTLLISVTSYGLILRASNRTKVIFVLNTIACVITILIGILIIPIYKMNGAILTACIAIVLPGIFQLVAEMRQLKSTATEFFPIKNILIVLISALLFSPIIFVFKYINMNEITYLFISFFSYFFVISLVLFRFNLFPFKDKINLLMLKLVGERRFGRFR